MSHLVESREIVECLLRTRVHLGLWGSPEGYSVIPDVFSVCVSGGEEAE